MAVSLCFEPFNHIGILRLHVAAKELIYKNINIKEDLLMAQQKEQDQLYASAGQRLLHCIGRKVTFRDTLPENKPLTLASLHKMSRKDVYSGDAIRKRPRQTRREDSSDLSLPTKQNARRAVHDLEAGTDARPSCFCRNKRQSVFMVKGQFVSSPHT